MKNVVCVPVHLSPKDFRQFAFFDTFRVRRRWQMPLAFFLIMALFSAVCFLQHGIRNAVLLGCVLLGVGILVPLAYVLSYLFGVNEQAKKNGLPAKPLVYTLTMQQGARGLSIQGVHGEEKIVLEWKQVFGAYRVKDCIYLYLSPERAFLLPEGQGGVTGDELYAFLAKALSERRVADCRSIFAVPKAIVAVRPGAQKKK